MLEKIKELLWGVKTIDEKSIKVLNRRQQALEALNVLKNRKNNFSYKLASVKTCICTHENLIDFLSSIIEINDIVSEGRAIRITDVMCNVKEYNVKQLLTNKGMYISLDIVKLFINESEKLCKYLESGDNEISGPMYHNQRVLIAHLGAIREVSFSLNECYI